MDLTVEPSPPVASPTAIATLPPDETIVASPTITLSKKQPVHIYPFAPDVERLSSTSNNLWWSDDSSTLFYQDEFLMNAWMYVLETGSSIPISYTGRSLDDIYVQVAPRMPDESVLYAASPQQQYLLFAVPLPALIPLTPPRFDDETVNPAYVAELWAFRNDQIDYLGLVDYCFLVSQPRWALHENKAVINAINISDVQRACMADIWIVDLDSFKVEPFQVTLAIDTEYVARDLSPDGSHMLISERGSNPKRYLFAFATGDFVELEYSISLTTLLEREGWFGFEGQFAFIGQEIEYGTSINDYYVSIWYVESSNKEPTKLATFRGLVSQWSISPDQNHIAVVISSREAYRSDDSELDLDYGIWLITLP